MLHAEHHWHDWTSHSNQCLVHPFCCWHWLEPSCRFRSILVLKAWPQMMFDVSRTRTLNVQPLCTNALTKTNYRLWLQISTMLVLIFQYSVPQHIRAYISDKQQPDTSRSRQSTAWRKVINSHHLVFNCICCVKGYSFKIANSYVWNRLHK